MTDCIERDIWMSLPDDLPYKGSVKRVLMQAPAADVKPVVLCRDCVYRKAAKVNDYGFLICSASGMDITDDDYCSYGVKEKEEDA